jgi:hypothetical protein
LHRRAVRMHVRQRVLANPGKDRRTPHREKV